MRNAIATLFAALLVASPATAIECDEWTRLAPASKPGAIQQLIEARLSSDEAQRYTSANHVNIRACMQPQVPRLVAQFDGVCAEGMSASMDALDEVFDQYFLSCVR
jgi:hypothetical protein